MINAEEIRAEIKAAPKGAKGAIVNKWASLLNVSKDTIYRAIRKKCGASKKVVREKKTDMALIDYIGKMKIEAARLGNGEREMATEVCIEIMVDSGVPGADKLTVSTVNRLLAENGYRDPERIVRVEAAYSNQMHQVDFSRSKYFQVKGYDSQAKKHVLVVGKRVLEYKEDLHKMRLWMFGGIDAFSRVGFAMADVLAGESVIAGVQFFQAIYGREKDNNKFYYLPETVKMDNGSLGKNKDFLNMLNILGIHRELVRPYEKRGIQKAEAQWRGIWQRFEMPFAYKLKSKGINTLYLEDYNSELYQFFLRRNQEEHPVYKSSRNQVYESRENVIKQRDFKDEMPFYRTYQRKIDSTCCISIDTQKYECSNDKYIGKWVKAYLKPDGTCVAELRDEYSNPFIMKAVDGFVELGDFEGRQKQTYKQSLEEQIKISADAARQHPLTPLEGGTKASSERVMYMKPRVENVEPETVFTQAAAEETTFKDVYEAKKYIGELIHMNDRTETYATYAEVFDAVLEEENGLDKEYINQVWNLILNKAAIG
jgi:hypothetical protein